MFEASVAVAGSVWLNVRSGRIAGKGNLVPQLVFGLTARSPRERIQIELISASARLSIGSEFAGSGTLPPASVGWHDTQLQVEIPIPLEALDQAERLAGEGPVRISLGLSGVMRVLDESAEPQRFASTLSQGEWHFVPFGQGTPVDLPFEVARSTWFEQVREPLGTLRYLSLELPLPKAGDALSKSASHLRNAERDLATGNDSGVFANCRAAVEALPGAPKHIFDGLADDTERKLLDDLLLAAGKYLHRGRHVDASGSFPVTRHDAGFALNLTRVTLSHVAHVLSRGY